MRMTWAEAGAGEASVRLPRHAGVLQSGCKPALHPQGQHPPALPPVQRRPALHGRRLEARDARSCGLPYLTERLAGAGRCCRWMSCMTTSEQAEPSARYVRGADGSAGTSSTLRASTGVISTSWRPPSSTCCLFVSGGEGEVAAGKGCCVRSTRSAIERQKRFSALLRAPRIERFCSKPGDGARLTASLAWDVPHLH